MVFNAEQWARDHDKRDEERFEAMRLGLRNLWAVMAFIGMTFVSLSGWSLRNQYEAMAKNEAHATEQLNALYAVSGQVAGVQRAVVPKPQE